MLQTARLSSSKTVHFTELWLRWSSNAAAWKLNVRTGQRAPRLTSGQHLAGP